MDILKHRVSSIEQINPTLGLEIDVRDFETNIVVSHDPPTNKNIKFSEILKKLSKKQLLAINVKSVEIETELKNILDENNITNYFTFDWPIPSMFKAIDRDLHTAFRLSEYETTLFPNCKWVWIDSFHKIWYDNPYLESLKKQNYKIALVSPELHGRQKELKQFRNSVNFNLVDAICTDKPEYWI